MPNHVKNIVTFEGDQVKINEMLEFIKGDDKIDDKIMPIDFNKIIPMPAALNIESSTFSDHGFKIFDCFVKEWYNDNKAIPKLENFEDEFIKSYLVDKSCAALTNILKYDEKQIEQIFDLGRKAYNNCVNYGHKDWYEWCNANWGTKWNAYGCTEDSCPDALNFKTAWSPPIPVLKRLSLRYPDIMFTHTWANEDILSGDVGLEVYHKGSMYDDPDDTLVSLKERIEFALKVWGYEVPEDYGIALNEDGEYVYVE